MQTQVVGICEDFDFQSAQNTIKPYVFVVFGQYGWDLPRRAYIRTVAGADIAQVREYIHQTIVGFSPDVVPENINVRFFDDEIEIIYQKEDKLSTLVTLFSFLSIIISIIGVFGLVLFETQYRRREIALRRVHGAQIREILQMFVVQYAKMVGIAFVVATPISILIMMRWLQTFAYHTPLHWWVFLIALAIVLAVTSAIVVARSWKAARENPVNALYKE